MEASLPSRIFPCAFVCMCVCVCVCVCVLACLCLGVTWRVYVCAIEGERSPQACVCVFASVHVHSPTTHPPVPLPLSAPGSAMPSILIQNLCDLASQLVIQPWRGQLVHLPSCAVCVCVCVCVYGWFFFSTTSFLYNLSGGGCNKANKIPFGPSRSAD